MLTQHAHACYCFGWAISLLITMGCKPLTTQDAAPSYQLLSETAVRPQVRDTEQNSVSVYSCDKPEVKPYFVLTLAEPHLTDRPFLIEVPASNQEAFAQLEQRVSHGFRPDTFGGILGRLVRHKPSPQHPWQIAFDPESIRIGDFTADVCDGSFEYADANAADYVGKRFCPFQSAFVVRRIEKLWRVPSCQETLARKEP